MNSDIFTQQNVPTPRVVEQSSKLTNQHDQQTRNQPKESFERHLHPRKSSPQEDERHKTSSKSTKSEGEGEYKTPNKNKNNKEESRSYAQKAKIGRNDDALSPKHTNATSTKSAERLKGLADATTKNPNYKEITELYLDTDSDAGPNFGEQNSEPEGLQEPALNRPNKIDEEDQTTEKPEHSPIISILTGQLNTIKPNNITATITQNSFIQEVVAKEDMASFFYEPQLASNITEALGISNHYPKGTILAPAEIINDLGIDKQVFLAELQALKGHLDTDGLHPYIERSSRLNAQPPTTTEVTPENSEEVIDRNPWNESIRTSNLHELDTKTSRISPQKLDFTSGNIKLTSERPNHIHNSDTHTDNIDPYEQIAQNWTSKHIQTFPVQESKNLQEALKYQSIVSNSHTEANRRTDETGIQEEYEILDTPIETDTSNEETLQIKADELSDNNNNNNNQDPENNGHNNHDDRSHHHETTSFSSEQNQNNSSTFNIEADHSVTESNAITRNSNIENIRKIILEKSQVLLKEGGGSIKIDLGTDHLGSIDLVIDIQDQKLQLRITAESDQAREMITQDLPALRQSLLDQSLDLKAVEVGVRYQESWSSDGQSGFDQDQEHREQFYHDSTADDSPAPIRANKTRNQPIEQIKVNLPGNIHIRV